MRTASRALLTSPAFLLAVGVLAVNDWALKPTFDNWITGKLSDVAGLFALPLLCCAFFPARRKEVFGLVTVAFLLWKSPLVDPALAGWNSLGVWHLRRVVDYTDYIALLMLAPAYRLARRHTASSLGAPVSPARRVGAVLSAAGAVLVFAADVVAPPRYPLPDVASYTVAASRTDVQNGLQALGFSVRDLSRAEGRIMRADTLALDIRQPPERDVAISIEVKEASPTEVRVTLLEARTFGPAPNTSSLERAFEKQVVAPLRDWVASHRRGAK
jgi:hypothetical protein